MKLWKKILFGILLGMLIVIVGGGIAFSAFRAKGEKNLKGKTEDEGSEYCVSYNGKEYKYKEDVINILCLGIDKGIEMEEARENGSYGLADAILLVSIDTKNHTLKIIAIPRDTMTDVRMADETGQVVEKQKMQLTYQYSYGKSTEQSGELMGNAVSELLYMVPVQRYCAINFQAFPIINDAIGGVDVEVLENMTWWRKEFVQGQMLHLDGDLAFDYVHQRNQTKFGSNLKRVERQKQYIAAFLEKSKEVVKKDVTLPIMVFKQIQKHMSTNLTVEDITYLVPQLLNMEIRLDEIQMIPGEIVMGSKYEEYYPDEEGIKELVINNFYEEVKP